MWLRRLRPSRQVPACERPPDIEPGQQASLSPPLSLIASFTPPEEVVNLEINRKPVFTLQRQALGSRISRVHLPVLHKKLDIVHFGMLEEAYLVVAQDMVAMWMVAH
jgi:hypothetical protein